MLSFILVTRHRKHSDFSLFTDRPGVHNPQPRQIAAHWCVLCCSRIFFLVLCQTGWRKRVTHFRKHALLMSPEHSSTYRYEQLLSLTKNVSPVTMKDLIVELLVECMGKKLNLTLTISQADAVTQASLLSNFVAKKLYSNMRTCFQ